VMTIEEIYLTDYELIGIETELIRIFSQYGPIDSPHGILNFSETGRQTVDSLFERRKELLDSAFQLDDEGQEHDIALDLFNAHLKTELLDMRGKAIEAFYALPKSCFNDSMNVCVEGRCYMDCELSESHPIQTDSMRKMWAILTGAIGYVSPHYKDGVLGHAYKYDGKGEGSENMLLYHNKQVVNWNEGLDPALTADMNLSYAFHNLHVFNRFSMFDLIWVRDFTSKITLTIDNSDSNSLQTFEWFIQN
ncbi:MAG: hypothetical protein LUD72_04945, partial [Bacteroidales bacterium]|nr:hypothetical protein [Bacteroidales bacterium]